MHSPHRKGAAGAKPAPVASTPIRKGAAGAKPVPVVNTPIKKSPAGAKPVPAGELSDVVKSATPVKMLKRNVHSRAYHKAVRAAILAGEVPEAAKLLGRCAAAVAVNSMLLG